jgi:hypothetical protein
MWSSFFWRLHWFLCCVKACGWEHDQNQAACTSLWPRMPLFFFGNALLALGLYPTLVGLEPSAWLKVPWQLESLARYIVAHCRTIHVCGFINSEIYVDPVSLQNPKSSNATMVSGVWDPTHPLCHSVQWRLMAHWLCPMLGSSRPVVYSISGGEETWWAFGRFHRYCYYLNLIFDFRCATRPRNSKIPLVHPLGTWHGHFRFGPICACVESNIWLKSSAKLAQIATSP